MHEDMAHLSREYEGEENGEGEGKATPIYPRDKEAAMSAESKLIFIF
jgi:hypothetical protein